MAIQPSTWLATDVFQVIRRGRPASPARGPELAARPWVSVPKLIDLIECNEQDQLHDGDESYRHWKKRDGVTGQGDGVTGDGMTGDRVTG
jgi:hypothetical protein